MSHHNKLFETAEIVFRKLYIIYNIQYTYHVSSQIIFSSTKGAKRREKFMFIVAIVKYWLRSSKQLVSLELSLFLRCCSYPLSQGPLIFCKSICPRHGFAGPEALTPFHLLLGSTRWYLPALAYANDRHVTDVISVMYRQSRVSQSVRD